MTATRPPITHHDIDRIRTAYPGYSVDELRRAYDTIAARDAVRDPVAILIANRFEREHVDRARAQVAAESAQHAARSRRAAEALTERVERQANSKPPNTWWRIAKRYWAGQSADPGPDAVWLTLAELSQWHDDPNVGDRLTAADRRRDNDGSPRRLADIRKELDHGDYPRRLHRMKTPARPAPLTDVG